MLECGHQLAIGGEHLALAVDPAVGRFGAQHLDEQPLGNVQAVQKVQGVGDHPGGQGAVGILMGAGVYSNCIRVLVPLVATQSDIDEGMAILDQALGATG